MNRRSFLLAVAAAASEKVLSSPTPGPASAIRSVGPRLSLAIDPAGWGTATPDNIRAVCLSAAGEIWSHCAGLTLPGLCLRRRKESPLCAYNHDARGRVVIFITTQGTFWAQMAFQFAHEFSHAIIDHSNGAARKWHGDHANKWFDECLCETASLFSLRAMARSWRTRPPYPNWRNFSRSLWSYADQRMAVKAHQLPPDTTFTEWFHAHEPILRLNPTLRDKNSIVAAQLLPIFEQIPAAWEALSTLNLGSQEPAIPIERHLADWKQHTPAALRPAVARIAAVFSA